MQEKSNLYNKAGIDHRIICDSIETDTRVLDLGCGDGTLMFLLAKEKNAKTQGIELSEEGIYQCVEKGLNVFHGDIEGGLIEYPDKSFDYVILNESMQEIKNVEYVINEALRVGEKVIIGFPNFSYIGSSYQLCFRQRTPITKSLPYKWYDTPNLHFLTIRDFIEFCKEKNVRILERYYINTKKKINFFPSALATNGIFLIQK